MMGISTGPLMLLFTTDGAVLFPYWAGVSLVEILVFGSVLAILAMKGQGLG